MYLSYKSKYRNPQFNTIERSKYRYFCSQSPSFLKTYIINMIDTENATRTGAFVRYLNQIAMPVTANPRQQFLNCINQWSHNDLCVFLVKEKIEINLHKMPNHNTPHTNSILTHMFHTSKQNELNVINARNAFFQTKDFDIQSLSETPLIDGNQNTELPTHPCEENSRIFIVNLPQDQDGNAQITDDDMPKVAQGTDDLPKVAQGTDDLPKVAQGSDDLPKVAQGNDDLPKVAQGSDDLPKVAQGSDDLPKVAQGSDDLPKVAQGSDDLPKVAQGSDDLPKVAQGSDDMPKVAQGSDDLPKVAQGSDALQKVAQGSDDMPKVVQGSDDNSNLTKGVVSDDDDNHLIEEATSKESTTTLTTHIENLGLSMCVVDDAQLWNVPEMNVDSHITADRPSQAPSNCALM
jgi:cytochrome c5